MVAVAQCSIPISIQVRYLTGAMNTIRSSIILVSKQTKAATCTGMQTKQWLVLEIRYQLEPKNPIEDAGVKE